jgi:hypothetical protein
MKIRQTFIACLLLLSLGVLSGFSSILHSHELDLHDNHEDCLSCEWNQVSFDTTPFLSEAFCSLFNVFDAQASEAPDLAAFLSTFLSRAPPSFW